MTKPQLSPAVGGGARAALAAQLVSQGLGLVVLAVLYRLVEPADFGLVGMVSPLVLFLRTCLSLGLSAAAVQRAQLSAAQQNSLFWLQQGAGVATALATAAAGPLLAWWYGAPELSLLCAALAGTSLAATFGSQHLALLERELDFGRIAAARLAAQLAGGAASVGAALAGWGVWSLVVQQYVELTLLSGLAWVLSPWRPHWPRRDESLAELLRFGGYFSLSNLFTVIALNADNVILSIMLGGTKQGQALIGMYAQAFNLMFKPVYMVTTPVNSIALAALSRATQHRDTYAALCGSFIRLVAVVLLPCGVGLCLTARDVLFVLGGDKWRDAGILLEVLSPAILAHGLIGMCTPIFSSAGRTPRLAWSSFVKALLYVSGYAIGFYVGGYYQPPPFGPTLGVAYGHALVVVGGFCLPYMLSCLLSVGVAPGPVFRLLVRPFLAAALMGLTVWGLRLALATTGAIPPPARLVALIVVGVISYLVFAWPEVRWLYRELRGEAALE